MIDDLIKPGIRSIPPYIPGDSAESVRDQYHVSEIFKLASNENQLGTSPKALVAMEEAIKASNIYPDAFCDGLRTKLGRRFGFEDPASHVVIAVGASGAISLLGEVFIEPGDEVIFCEPTFGAYASAARRNSGVPIVLPLTGDLTFDLDAIAAAITDKTKLIFICNPNNPTGTVVDSEALRAFIHKLPSHVVCAVDEAYIEFSDDPEEQSMASEIDEGVNLVVMRTFSKIYGLAGLRLGYMLTNKEIQNVLQKSTSVFVAGRAALAGGMAALDDEEFLTLTYRSVTDGRNFLTDEFTKLGWTVYPSQTNFLYVDTGLDTKAFAAACKKRGLIIRGNFEFSRITIGTDYQNGRMIEIIRDVLASGEVPERPEK